MSKHYKIILAFSFVAVCSMAAAKTAKELSVAANKKKYASIEAWEEDCVAILEAYIAEVEKSSKELAQYLNKKEITFDQFAEHINDLQHRVVSLVKDAEDKKLDEVVSADDAISKLSKLSDKLYKEAN